ncbi:MAG: group II intron maturase-specific domain-containing protein [Streptosporangiaceae bacterium]
MPEGEFDSFGLGPQAVAVHDRLKVGVLDLDIRAHSAHTRIIHLACRIRVPALGAAAGTPVGGAVAQGCADARVGTKTKIAYCKDSMRRGTYDTVTFTFLGYAFRPRQVKGKNGQIFTSFTPAISPEALRAKSQVVRGWRIHMRAGTSLNDLAKAINPIVEGWINYYGLSGRNMLN